MYIEWLVEKELLIFEAPDKQDVDPLHASDADLRAMGLTVIDGGRV